MWHMKCDFLAAIKQGSSSGSAQCETVETDVSVQV